MKWQAIPAVALLMAMRSTSCKRRLTAAKVERDRRAGPRLARRDWGGANLDAPRLTDDLAPPPEQEAFL